MGEGSRGRLLSLLGRRKGQTTEVLSLWEREAGADYSTVLMREGRRGRLQKYCPYGRGKQGQTIVLSLCGMGEGADYRSTVPMGEGGGQIYYGSFHGG